MPVFVPEIISSGARGKVVFYIWKEQTIISSHSERGSGAFVAWALTALGLIETRSRSVAHDDWRTDDLP